MTTVRASLVPHPATPAGAVAGLGAQASLSASGRLQLHWVLRGDLAALAIPMPAAQRFREGLWRHTCVEAFLAADGAAAYRELNVSPSREWAAYSFAGYREGMARLEHASPSLAVRRGPDRVQIDAALEVGHLFEKPWTTLRLGLAAVVEAADGTLSYWALRHPVEKPDFHHRGGFLLSLGPGAG